MRWSADHPVRTDAALAPFAAGADELCPDADVVEVLRYLPGRRVASLVRLATGEHAVLKVFASPRARGNHRRLARLAGRVPAGTVPRSLGADARGHVLLLEHVPGSVYDTTDDGTFVAVARRVGAALRALHAADVDLDRAWTLADELAQLTARAPESTVALVEHAIGRLAIAPDARLVVAHRDCHPRQVVIDRTGAARWIDLDDAAMAPAGLDVGNFVAHLRREAVIGTRTDAVAEAAVAGFLAGYGTAPDDVEAWEELARLRLAGLATTRHARPDWTARLCEPRRAEPVVAR